MMQPVIHPNRHQTKTPIAIARQFQWFDRALYRLHATGERTLGGQGVFRKLVLSYVWLPEIRKGGRLFDDPRLCDFPHV